MWIQGYVVTVSNFLCPLYIGTCEYMDDAPGGTPVEGGWLRMAGEQLCSSCSAEMFACTTPPSTNASAWLLGSAGSCQAVRVRVRVRGGFGIRLRFRACVRVAVRVRVRVRVRARTVRAQAQGINNNTVQHTVVTDRTRSLPGNCPAKRSNRMTPYARNQAARDACFVITS